ncbi:MAG: helix-turn-helix domain-containing protein [Peptococcaceae bacterium]|nr:helix-turn-helix domain-containing protein [Peptococcaceae bacterium]
MARKKFEEGFKENAIEYCKTHSDMTIKACAAELGIGYSTLRRWISQSEEQAESATMVENVEVVASDEKALAATEDMSEETDVAEVQKDAAESKTIVSAAISEAPVVEKNAPMADAQEEASIRDCDADDVAVQMEAVQEDLDDEFDWVNKHETVKTQLGELIENAGNGVSEAVQLIGLYKKRRELKKVQKKLQKEKEKRMKR